MSSMHERIEEAVNERRQRVILGMQQEIRRINVEHGWYDEDREFGMDIALLHSEVSEMLEAYRDGQTEGVTWKFVSNDGYSIFHESDSNAQRWLATMDDGRLPDGRTAKPLGVAIEAADVLIRLLDTCERLDVNLAEAYRLKVAYNRTRPYRHGGKKA